MYMYIGPYLCDRFLTGCFHTKFTVNACVDPWYSKYSVANKIQNLPVFLSLV